MRKDEDKNILEQGFTLVELLIVVVILGILAGIVVFAVGNLTQGAGNNACGTEASTIETAVEAWRATPGNIGNPTFVQLGPAPAGANLIKDITPKYDSATSPVATPTYTYSTGTGLVVRNTTCSA